MIVTPEKALELAEAIIQLSQDSESRQLYGGNGRQYAENKLSKDQILKKFEQDLKNLISK